LHACFRAASFFMMQKRGFYSQANACPPQDPAGGWGFRWLG